MQLLAETLRRKGCDATSVAYYKAHGALAYRNDIELGVDPENLELYRLLGLVRFVPEAVRNFDIFHFFFGQSLIPRFQWDLPLLRRMGKRIVVHFRGSDIADRRLLQGSELKTFAHAKGLERVSLWRKYADRMLVSTPDLLRIVPDAVIVPQAIDLNRWQFVGCEATSPRPIRVAHAPSNRAIKGTDTVVESVEQLRAEGVELDLVLIENTNPAEVARIYATCDVAVDQLRIGWYGNFAVEMMALGKPVIAHIDPALKYDAELPIIPATQQTFCSVLRETVRRQDRWSAIGTAGRRYVERHHAADVVATRLLHEYGLAIHRPRDG